MLREKQFKEERNTFDTRNAQYVPFKKFLKKLKHAKSSPPPQARKKNAIKKLPQMNVIVRVRFVFDVGSALLIQNQKS